ncbi:MAG: hypothetical protein PHG66_04200 [Candidatus Colwellbacteria bacterium]|nr:hypothetical protein [Candidatus Colwellbacteria bacterium]
MKKTSIFLSLIALAVIVGFVSNRAYASESQTITLYPGWNTVSTPKVLTSHSFSVPETISNFDLYTLDPSNPSGWSTVTSEFSPLYGYLVNNKTGENQQLTLNFQENLNPNERLFERDFNNTGWYLFGPANPSYTKKQGSNTADTNNVSSILESVHSSYSDVIDFTDNDSLMNPDSVKVGSIWKSAVPVDINNIRDLRETKGYAIYINSVPARYTGFQNNTDSSQPGSLFVSQFGSLPKTSVHVGEHDVVLERFTVSADSNEAVNLSRIILTKSGTASDSDISNLRIRKVGETDVLGGPVSVESGSATFNLTGPINISEGASVNLEFVGDISGGDNHTVSFAIAGGDIIGQGVDSGTNIASTGTTSANTITIGSETITVSMSTNHPQGDNAVVIETTNRKALSKFDVRANGGDVILNTINAKFIDSTDDLGADNYLSSVGIYDGDSLISDFLTVDDEDDQNFSLNYTIPANTTKTLTIKGITNTLTPAEAGDTFTSVWSGYSGYGLTSGASITSNSDVMTTAITIYPSGSVTASADTTKTPYNQTIVAPSNNVTIAVLKVYAQKEDMKLNDIILTVSGLGYTDGDILSVSLYADDGVTALSNPVANSNNNYSFSNADFLNDIIVPKSTYKTILIKANVLPSIDGASGVVFSIADIADHLKFIGQDSGILFDNSTDEGAVNFAISSPYNGGTFSFDTKVVTLQKASTSPSGAVSRGTQSVIGIWDVINHDSTNADAVLTSIRFTSKTGLPSALDNADNTDDNLFSLYDEDGNRLAGGLNDGTQVVLDKNNGTITFTKAGMLTIPTGSTKQLKLVVNTTNTAKFASGTQFQWSLESANDVVITDGGVGYASGIWTIPAATNVITLP